MFYTKKCISTSVECLSLPCSLPSLFSFLSNFFPTTLPYIGFLQQIVTDSTKKKKHRDNWYLENLGKFLPPRKQWLSGWLQTFVVSMKNYCWGHSSVCTTKNIFTIDFPPALIYHLTPSIMRFVGWFLSLSGIFLTLFFFFLFAAWRGVGT